MKARFPNKYFYTMSCKYVIISIMFITDGNASPLRWSPPSSAALVAAALAPPALRPWLPDPPTKKSNHLGKTGIRSLTIFVILKFIYLFDG